MTAAKVIFNALTAARGGEALSPEIAAKLKADDLSFPVSSMKMDSLAVMEFCISIELETGRELTPDRLAHFKTFHDIAAWLHDQPGK